MLFDNKNDPYQIKKLQLSDIPKSEADFILTELGMWLKNGFFKLDIHLNDGVFFSLRMQRRADPKTHPLGVPIRERFLFSSFLSSIGFRGFRLFDYF